MPHAPSPVNLHPQFCLCIIFYFFIMVVFSKVRIKADFIVKYPLWRALYTLPPFISPYSVLLNKKKKFLFMVS